MAIERGRLSRQRLAALAQSSTSVSDAFSEQMAYVVVEMRLISQKAGEANLKKRMQPLFLDPFLTGSR